MSSNAVCVVERPELIFGLVGPAGVRREDLTNQLKQALKTFGYDMHVVKLSDLLRNFSEYEEPVEPSEHARIKHLQLMGHKLRERLKDSSALAKAGVIAIRNVRKGLSGSPDQPTSSKAYLLDQLKHPGEVEVLRKVYGSSFYLIGGHAPKNKRAETLAATMAKKDGKAGRSDDYKHKAEEILALDENEGGEYGQNTRDTYPLSDYFSDLNREPTVPGISRFVDLIFAYPFHTPESDEVAMNHASSVALRSSDTGRQVGAVIVGPNSKDQSTGKITYGDLVASGMNEVPKAGGDYYQQDASPDGRDQWLKAYRSEDRATEIKASVLAELLEHLKSKCLLVEGTDATQGSLKLAETLLHGMRGTQFMDIGEFVRPVHAEMSAIIDGAKRGVSIRGLSMFVTTFPCHNCAKHIIAAGIKSVVFLEPYPKSRARFLHEEEIWLKSSSDQGDDTKVVFMPYTGVAPRQFRQLFNMSHRKAHSISQWKERRTALSPIHIHGLSHATYTLAERELVLGLDEAIYEWDRKEICP